MASIWEALLVGPEAPLLCYREPNRRSYSVRPLDAVFISRFFLPSQPSPRAEFSPNNFLPSLLISARDRERVPSSAFVWRGSGIKQKPDPRPCLCPRPLSLQILGRRLDGRTGVPYSLTVLVFKKGTANDIPRERILARLGVGPLFFLVK